MQEVFVARQPIYDLEKNVFGYEILYRSNEQNTCGEVDGSMATASSLLNSFLTFGLNNLTNGKPVFINFAENFIIDEIPMMFPSSALVVEILETVEPSAIILEKCRELHEKGYRIALDDFIFREEYAGLISYVDIIKLDFRAMDRAQLRNVLTVYREHKHLRYLAEKVETAEEYEIARKIGCTLFQGYYFGKPVIKKTQGLAGLNAAYVSLMSEVNKDELDFDEISRLILRDMQMTYFLLRMVNSPAFGMIHKVTTVRHALVVLGAREIRKWISLTVIDALSKGKPGELVQTSLLRARMAELIAQLSGHKEAAESCFLAGLFSLLDAILDRPFGQIVNEIYLPDTVRLFLLGEPSELAPVIGLVVAYERGAWEQVRDCAVLLGLQRGEVVDAYLSSLKWQHELFSD